MDHLFPDIISLVCDCIGPVANDLHQFSLVHNLLLKPGLPSWYLCFVSALRFPDAREVSDREGVSQLLFLSVIVKYKIGSMERRNQFLLVSSVLG